MADLATKPLSVVQTDEGQSDQARKPHKWEALEFRITLYCTYWLFLFGAILMRVTGQRPRILTASPDDKRPRRSVFGEAWEMASASIAFAFASR